MIDAWPDPEAALAGFLAKYDPDIADKARTAMRRLRDRLPAADAMIYDNYNGLVMGFSPDERPSNAILSLLALPGHITLCFLQGARLDDPDGLLKGAGSTVRHVRLKGPDDLDDPKIAGLIDRALSGARVPPAEGRKGRMYVKSVSAKQRPRSRM
ncbi:MAG: DUF1801 domain-containing protein [Caulobacterales bacterium]|nr:DUF1801 domain-containing protein [Caulobacterales bacterium]